MEKCKKCSVRKGKRKCSALNGWICTKCCGTFRLTEICCPYGCPHLEEGEEYQKERRTQRGMRTGKEYLSNRIREFEHGLELELAIFTEWLLFRALKEKPDLSPQEILNALDFALAAFGPIIRLDVHKSELGKKLFEAVRGFGRKRAIGPFMTRRCLERIKGSVRFLTEEKKDPEGYKKFIFPYFEEMVSKEEKRTPVGKPSEIIIP